ncbi:MAG: M23 family metallopeptidase [Patescibacteria group bacterium]
MTRTRTLCLTLMTIVACACGTPEVDRMARDKQPVGLSDGLEHACHPLVDVRDLLTDEEIRNIPVAEDFSPPVMNGEDTLVNHLTGEIVGPSDYAVTTRLGDNVRTRDGRLLINHAGVDYDEGHSSIQLPGDDREDARYPVRAVADGVVVFAGLVCDDNSVLNPPTEPLERYAAWGIAIRILHRRVMPSGEVEYYLSVYAHLEGSTDPNLALDSLAVRVGDYITGRQVIATIGPTPESCAEIPWATHLHHELRQVYPFQHDTSDSNQRVMMQVLNEQGTGYGGTPGRVHYVDPTAFYSSYGYSAAGGDVALNYPVGTVAYRVSWHDGSLRRDYYLVCTEGTLCHIADESAFWRHRFFRGSGDPWSYSVELSGAAYNCMGRGPNILDSGPTMSAITCGDDSYIAFVDGSNGYRRLIGYYRGTAAHRVLLDSWGFYEGELIPGGDLCRLPLGNPANLLLRDGSVVEAASDSDFYVVSNVGLAYRLRRETFMRMGYPFHMVMQIPDGSLLGMVSGIDSGHREFTFGDATSCLFVSGGGSEATCGDGSCGSGETYASCPEDCDDPAYCGDGTCDTYESAATCPADCATAGDECVQSSRRCADLHHRSLCVRDYEIGATVWETWPCGSGEECRDGRCVEVEVPDSYCGDGSCDADEDCASCPADCADCPEPEPPGPPELTCSTLADGRRRMSFAGDLLASVSASSAFVGDPQGIVLCGEHAGPWVSTYEPASGANVFVPWDDTDAMEADLSPVADGINGGVVDADGAVHWFQIAESGGLLSVGGECEVVGTLIRFDSGAEPEPHCGDGSCGASEDCSTCPADCGTCPEPESGIEQHTITCTASGGFVEMEVVGPVTDLLVGGTLSGPPIAIYAGCNGCGGWSLPYGDSDCRPHAEWLGDGATYRLLFPDTIDGCNLVAVDAAGNTVWFDIETAATADRWNVEGDCEVVGTLIVPR